MPGSVNMRDLESEPSEQCESLSSEGYEYEPSEEEEDSMLVEQDATVREASTSCANRGYTVIETCTIKNFQDAAADEICSIMACKKSIAKTLLMHFRWDKEALLSVLADRGEDYLYKVAGVVQSGTAEVATGDVAGDFMQCAVCCSEVERSVSMAMDCGHTYCNDCWIQHIKTQINDGQARSVRCMAFKCGVACDEDKVLVLLRSDPTALDKYQQSRLLSYVEDNSNVRFCPSVPWCGRAVQVEGDPFCEPECSCGMVFCFKCGKAPHSPCTCAMFNMWDEKTHGDSETKNWMMANTKPCPKCTKSVEKNGGCNHVVCKCGQAFCWLCGASTGMAHSWQKIEGHSCGRWKEDMDRKIDEAARNHKRYMHYFERYKMHSDSHQKEKIKRQELLKDIDSKVESGVEARDYSWLVRALDQLKAARGVLAATYVFAYFFFGNELYKEDFSEEQNLMNQNLFEDQQQMLEGEVERLSGLVQACSESLTIDPEERVKVINSSVNIGQRILRLFDLIEVELYGKLQTCAAQIAMYKPISSKWT